MDSVSFYPQNWLRDYASDNDRLELELELVLELVLMLELVLVLKLVLVLAYVHI